MTLPPLVDGGAYTAWQAGDDDQDLDAAMGAVRAYCGWHIAPEITETVVVDGNPRGEILFQTMHLTAVEDLAIDGSVLDAEDYLVKEAGFVVLNNGWSWYPWSSTYPYTNAVTATITHGYADVPPEVQEVVFELASSRPGSGARVSRMSVGQVSQTFVDDVFDPYTRSRLDAYRVVPLS
jgi:hypothetical protein